MRHFFKLVTKKVRRLWDRDVVVVETSAGKQTFYRRTGRGGTHSVDGALPGMWAPFFGVMEGLWIVKLPRTKEDSLYRYGTEENRAAGKWLDSLKISVGEDVSWRRLNWNLHRIGVIGKPVKRKDGTVSYASMQTAPTEQG